MKNLAYWFITIGVIKSALAFSLALTCAEPSKEAGNFPSKLCKWLLAIGIIIIIIGVVVRIFFV